MAAVDLLKEPVTGLMRDHIERVIKMKYEQLEKLAAAFLLECQLPPSEVELVETVGPREVTYHYRRRDGK